MHPHRSSLHGATGIEFSRSLTQPRHPSRVDCFIFFYLVSTLRRRRITSLVRRLCVLPRVLPTFRLPPRITGPFVFWFLRPHPTRCRVSTSDLYIVLYGLSGRSTRSHRAERLLVRSVCVCCAPSVCTRSEEARVCYLFRFGPTGHVVFGLARRHRHRGACDTRRQGVPLRVINWPYTIGFFDGFGPGRIKSYIKSSCVWCLKDSVLVLKRSSRVSHTDKVSRLSTNKRDYPAGLDILIFFNLSNYKLNISYIIYISFDGR